MYAQAPSPANDHLRLKESDFYPLLNSRLDKEFDELALLAAHVCQCPIVALFLHLNGRRWAKATAEGNPLAVGEEGSFLSYALQHEEELVVADALQDERFCRHRYVTGAPHIRYYAATPLYSSSGVKLGVVAMADSRPRAITDNDRVALQLVARQAVALLELRAGALLLHERTEAVKALFGCDRLPRWICDPATLKILEVNEAALKTYGYSREEFLRLTPADLHSEDEDRSFTRQVQALEAGGQPVSFRAVHRKKNGEPMAVAVTLQDVPLGAAIVCLVTIENLTQQQALEEKLQREHSLSVYKISQVSQWVKEREREVIGEELHDNINQILSGTKMFLEMADSNEALRAELVRRSKANIVLAMDEIRKLSKTLVGPQKETFYLLPSVQELIDLYHTAPAFEVDFTHRGAVEALPGEVKRTLFRIMQEQLHNISRHAQASKVWLTVALDEKLRLSIRDNGRGFDPAQHTEGIGLRNIRSRARFYGGTVRISSAPAEGCTLVVELPDTWDS